MGELVLVTGGSGYIGGWCVAELLRRGYQAWPLPARRRHPGRHGRYGPRRDAAGPASRHRGGSGAGSDDLGREHREPVVLRRRLPVGLMLRRAGCRVARTPETVAEAGWNLGALRL